MNKWEKAGSQYAILAVFASIALVLVLIAISPKGNAVSTNLSDLFKFNSLLWPSLAGLFGCLLSAYYFGKKAGANLSQEGVKDSVIGFTTGLKILLTGSFAGSLAGTTQFCWGQEAPLWFIFFDFFRWWIPFFLIGVPLTLVMGYSFGKLLLIKMKSNQR